MFDFSSRAWSKKVELLLGKTFPVFRTTIVVSLSYFENVPEVCGNKMPTRCNRCFLLQILLLAQHVSGTIIPIIRSSRVLYSWLPHVVFGVVNQPTV
jgi:hypothetical protein